MVIHGTPGDDSLSGSSEPDLLLGADGNDTLTGFTSLLAVEDAGRDTLDGGLGDDVYHVRHGDTVRPDPGGTDTVHAWNTDWTLDAGLDHLVFQDTRGLFFVGRGNGLDNVLDGSRAEGVALFGEDGDDFLISASFGGINRLYGGAGNDTLHGGDHSDELYGGPGSDLLIGGRARDVFVFDRAADGAAVDRIVDFEPGIDEIRVVGGEGGVIVDMATGEVYYDPDGSGSAPPVLIATATGTSSTDISGDTAAEPDDAISGLLTAAGAALAIGAWLL